MSSAPRILLMAGGTGGHIFPALAVAELLSEKGWETHWLGSENGMEVSLIPKYNINMSLLKVKAVRGKGLLTSILSPLHLINAVWQAMKVINEFRPDVVLGMGGFVSGPGGIAAWLLRRPLCIHEQNAIAGMTNRILSKFALYKLQAFPGALSKADAVTGNPVRKTIGELAQPEARFAERQGAIRLLIIGGSRGAAVFNQLLPEAVALIKEKLPLNIWHQTGINNAGFVRDSYTKQLQENLSPEVDPLKIEEFIDDIDVAYQWADLVLCRSGALTVSELAAVGLGAIFVPYPHAVDDHQTANAQYLATVDAAVIIQQSALNIESLTQAIEGIANRKKCLIMAKNAKKQGRTNATKAVADFCIKAVENNKRRRAA